MHFTLNCVWRDALFGFQCLFTGCTFFLQFFNIYDKWRTYLALVNHAIYKGTDLCVSRSTSLDRPRTYVYIIYLLDVDVSRCKLESSRSDQISKPFTLAFRISLGKLLGRRIVWVNVDEAI